MSLDSASTLGCAIRPPDFLAIDDYVASLASLRGPLNKDMEDLRNDGEHQQRGTEQTSLLKRCPCRGNNRDTEFRNGEIAHRCLENDK